MMNDYETAPFPKTIQPSRPISPHQKNFGISLHVIAVLFLLLAMIQSATATKYHRFDWATWQDAWTPALVAIVLSMLGAYILRSFLELGEVIACSVGCLLAVILAATYSGYTSGGLQLDALPPVAGMFVLAGLGAFLLKPGDYPDWKWWLIYFLPCACATLLLIPICRGKPGLFLISSVWIWYFASRNDYLYSVYRLWRWLRLPCFLVGFVLALFHEATFYPYLQSMWVALEHGIELTHFEHLWLVTPETPGELLLAIAWKWVAMILATTPIVILLLLEKETFRWKRKKSIPVDEKSP